LTESLPSVKDRTPDEYRPVPAPGILLHADVRVPDQTVFVIVITPGGSDAVGSRSFDADGRDASAFPEQKLMRSDSDMPDQSGESILISKV